MIEKYTMEGDLVESINIDGLPNSLCLVYDGTDFYCNSMFTNNPLSELYRIDLKNKHIIDTIFTNVLFGAATYDPEYDGFWLAEDYKVMLYDRQGNRIKSSPRVKNYIIGVGYHVSQDGYPHLLIYKESDVNNGQSEVYNYDITNNIIFNRPLLSITTYQGDVYGACVGKYDGKDAMFLSIGNVIQIYEIRSFLEHNVQIMHYRIYRSNGEGDSVMLADEVVGSTFIDSTWKDALDGTYRFGISSVFADGDESEIVWSNTIVKGDHGIGENPDSNKPTVQKIFENGQIVIIKDGKRYNITGQEINSRQ